MADYNERLRVRLVSKGTQIACRRARRSSHGAIQCAGSNGDDVPLALTTFAVSWQRACVKSAVPL